MADNHHNRLDNLVSHRWFPWLDLALAVIAGIMWSLGKGSLTWQPLLIALLPWFFRLLAGRFPFKRTPFDLPMLVFLLSAGVGVWAAYNRPDAWAKFWILVGAVLLFYALAGQPFRNLWLIIGVLGFSGVLAGAYFLLTHDWSAFPAKFGPLNQVLLRWMSIRFNTNLPTLPPNVAASLMAISIPLLVAWCFHAWRRRRKLFVAASVGAIGFVLIVLVVTTSRGAWVALTVVVGIGMLAWLSQFLARQLSRSRSLIFVSLLLLALVVIVLLSTLYPSGPVALIDQLPGPASGTSRYVLTQNTLDLIQDFPITGGGLRSFPGLYSQYILVLPAYVLPNGHNIFLDAALEQGPLGMIALTVIFLASLVLLAIKTSSQTNDGQDLAILRFAVAASLVIMLVHGLVEDTVYASQATLFLFTLPGLAVSTSLPKDQDIVALGLQTSWVAGPMALLLVLFVFAYFLTTRQSVASTWQANLGALRMAQAELVNWPTNQWDDGSDTHKLQASEPFFERSLAASATNRTAHHRLGLIAMLRRDFDEAVTHLELAWQLDGDHPGIRKALAYSYVWSGKSAEAQELLIYIPEAEQEMETYSWWWAEQGRDDLADYAGRTAIELNASGRTSEISQ